MKNSVRPYTEWEDYKAGMYQDPLPEHREQLVTAAAMLLSDQHRLMAAMRSVTTEWKTASDANLHEHPNNRAWLGQAACCYATGATEGITRSAWGTLTDQRREAANTVADQVINEWRRRAQRTSQLELFGQQEG
jgi:hypothetical protein